MCLQADMGLAERLVDKGEAKLSEYQHPDPYIVPYYTGAQAAASMTGSSTPVLSTCNGQYLAHTGGSLYARNPPFPKELQQHLNWGRENGH